MAENSNRIRRYAEEYTESKGLVKNLEKRTKMLRDTLMEAVKTMGDADPSGNMWLPAFDYMVKAERRRSITFSPAKAEDWLREHGWWDEACVTVPEEVIPAHEIIDEDALAAFIFTKSKDEANTFKLNSIPDEVYNEKENFALKVTQEENIEY